MPDNRGRSCIWAFLLYPESMPVYCWEFLEKCGLPVYVSPLHDRDKYTLEDVLEIREHGGVDANFRAIVPTDSRFNGTLKVGDIKKPHYHCMIRFASKQTPQAVMKFLAPLSVQWVLALGNKLNDDAEGQDKSWRGYARYLVHRDNPEKAQYDYHLVQAFNAPPYMVAAAVSRSAANAWVLAPLFDFIRTQGILDWSLLLDYLREYDPLMYETAFSNSGKVREYMKSIVWREYRLPVLENAKNALPVGDTTTHTRVLGSRSTCSHMLTDSAIISDN